MSNDTYRNIHLSATYCLHPFLLLGFLSRSKEYIGLNLSVVVWKALVGQEVQLSDLENVDVLLTRSMQDIRTIDQKGKKAAVAFIFADSTPTARRRTDGGVFFPTRTDQKRS